MMRQALKQYEYTTSVKGKIHHELERLDEDMRALQRWYRRSVSSDQKVKAIITVLKAHQTTAPNSFEPSSLLQDYEHLSDTIGMFGKRLESMLPFVASLVQIADSRRSFGETANISRLTIVALVFVPLAYVSSLFSMSQELGPGGSLFWLYFAVAIPVTTAVFFIVRPPSRMLTKLRQRVRRVRFPRVRGGQLDDNITTNNKTGV
jgi:Mg2+ and Co2+ transporter CorA